MATNKNTKTPIYRRVKDICVDMYTSDAAVEKRLLHGKVFLNSDKREILFAQNAPRGPRSVEIGRTLHSRYVRRPDGAYTVTFRCMGNEKNLRELLLVEVREIATMIKADVERRAI